MANPKQKHVRIVCPHCRKHVSLARPRGRLGFVKPVPCPSCHIPIAPAHIKAQTEPVPEPAGEGSDAESVETTPAEEGSGEDEAKDAE